jgi:hypothetical protein
LVGRPEDETDTGQPQVELARAVVRYFSEHPKAMDSVQGIADWWISLRQIGVDVEVLHRTLEQLTKEGLLEKVDSTEGPLYRLRRPT